jgi:hypothetical protein
LEQEEQVVHQQAQSQQMAFLELPEAHLRLELGLLFMVEQEDKAD